MFEAIKKMPHWILLLACLRCATQVLSETDAEQSKGTATSVAFYLDTEIRLTR